jgi:hypothetical protein
MKQENIDYQMLLIAQENAAWTAEQCTKKARHTLSARCTLNLPLLLSAGLHEYFLHNREEEIYFDCSCDIDKALTKRPP